MIKDKNKDALKKNTIMKNFNPRKVNPLYMDETILLCNGERTAWIKNTEGYWVMPYSNIRVALEKKPSLWHRLWFRFFFGFKYIEA